MMNKPIDGFFQQKELFLKKMAKAEKKGETKLILIIVANVLDPHIGKGCSQDIHSVRNMFDKLSEHMEFNLLEMIIKGEAYSKENVDDIIESIDPGDDDIVVFYYSGHGFRFEMEGSLKFPQVFLLPRLPSETSGVINKNSLNLTEIFEKIKAKGARLNLVIGDCCNTLIHFQRKFSGGDNKIRTDKRPDMHINKETCKGLFCDPRASILVASADENQFSITDDELGSIFTFNFTDNLKILMAAAPDSAKGLPWTKLLEQTKEKTFNLSKTYDIGGGVPGNQKAIFKIVSK
ncbi:MAG: hypothetical protein RIS73_2128 [Bacteroidota bacterium]|jgi:hypothetical protein